MPFTVTDKSGQSFTYKNTFNRPATHAVVASFPAYAGRTLCGQVIPPHPAKREIISFGTSLRDLAKVANHNIRFHKATEIEFLEVKQL